MNHQRASGSFGGSGVSSSFLFLLLWVVSSAVVVPQSPENVAAEQLVVSEPRQQQPTLYAIVTEFGIQDEVNVWTVIVDVSTGAVTNVTENFSYQNEAIMSDGISGFDSGNGIYYYATDDTQQPLIFAVNVRTKSLLAPVNLYPKAVYRLNADTKNHRLFAYVVDSQGNGVLNSIAFPAGPVKQIFTLPSSYNSQAYGASALDPQKRLWYWTAWKSATSYDLLTVNADTGSLLSAKPISCTNGYFMYMTWDPTFSTIWGGIEVWNKNNTLSYFVIRMDPTTGQCSEKLIDTDAGIVTSWTFDYVNSVLWYHSATDSGGMLYYYNVKSGKQGNSVLVADYLVLESIEIDNSLSAL